MPTREWLREWMATLGTALMPDTFSCWHLSCACPVPVLHLLRACPAPARQLPSRHLPSIWEISCIIKQVPVFHLLLWNIVISWACSRRNINKHFFCAVRACYLVTYLVRFLEKKNCSDCYFSEPELALGMFCFSVLTFIFRTWACSGKYFVYFSDFGQNPSLLWELIISRPSLLWEKDFFFLFFI